MYGLLYFKAESAKKSTFFHSSSECSVNQFPNPKIAKYNPQFSVNMNQVIHQSEPLRHPQSRSHLANVKFLHERYQNFKDLEDRGRVIAYVPKGNIPELSEDEMFDMATYLKDTNLENSKDATKKPV